MSDGLTDRQSKFLLAFRAQLGNVTAACEACGMHRSSIYAWLKSDESDVFRQKMDQVESDFLDLGESELLRLVRDGDFRAIKFFLQTKGRSRGYGKIEEIIVENKNGFTHVEADQMRAEYRSRKQLEVAEHEYVSTLTLEQQIEYWDDKLTSGGADLVKIERQIRIQPFFNRKFERDRKNGPVDRIRAGMASHLRKDN